MRNLPPGITEVPDPLEIKFKRLHPSATLPTKARESDAGIDLYAAESVIVPENGFAPVKTGIAWQPPAGWYGQIQARSKLAGLGLGTFAGVIDGGFRGEIVVFLVSHFGCGYGILSGDKIAQLILLPVPPVRIVEADELDDSDRGERGFGSSGR